MDARSMRVRTDPSARYIEAGGRRWPVDHPGEVYVIEVTGDTVTSVRPAVGVERDGMDAQP